ncbi:rCG59153, partial [Rattus norvegicus]
MSARQRSADRAEAERPTGPPIPPPSQAHSLPQP